MDIAMIGLGRMGANMAQRLQRGGHRVVGHDPMEAARARAAESGLEVFATLAEAVAGADLVIEAAVEDEAVKLDILRKTSAIGQESGLADRMRWVTDDPRPKFRIQSHDAGLVIAAGRKTDSADLYWRIAQLHENRGDLGLSDEQRYQVYEGNARRVFPRLDAALKAKGR